MVINGHIVYPSAIDRFFVKVRFGGKNGCWEWLAYKDQTGYGRFGFCNYSFPAHRFLWTYIYGQIPDGMFVIHKEKCLNRACVNPDHLFLGSPTDSVHYMAANKRHTFGEKHLSSKLNEEQVLLIRKMHRSKKIGYRNISKIFNVDKTTIYQIVKKIIWKHI